MSAQNDRLTGLVGNSAIKVPCRAATTAAIVLSGLQTVDGVVLAADDRILVKNQASSVDNGIYTVVTGGAWTRTKDCDGTYDLVLGSIVGITNGTVNAGLFYQCAAANPITIGTTALTWAVVSPSSPITLPLAIAQGGTGQATATAALGALNIMQLTGAAGTANAQTAAGPSSEGALAANQLFEYTPAITNTGAVTLTVTPSGGATLAAKNVFDNGNACVGGELVANRPVLLLYDGVQLNIIGRGLSNETEDINPDKTADYTWTYDASAKLYKKVLLQNASPLHRMAISGLTYSNNAGDAVNDLDFAVGSARDASDAANLFLTTAMTKQSDVAWAVGTNQGALDTGAVGNSDYYIWLIKRVDTGVVDILFSLSSTAPTMPANYTLKRLIGWFKRVGGTIVAFHTYETEGGGLEMNWDAPTLDINLANTLTTARRTDAVKVPLNFSVVATLNIVLSDATTRAVNWIYCPDQSDLAPSATAAPLNNFDTISATVTNAQGTLKVRTSATGTIAARSTLATVDLYAVATIGFTWARRN